MADQILESTKDAVQEAEHRLNNLKNYVYLAMKDQTPEEIDKVIQPAAAAIFSLNCSLGVYGEELTRARDRERYYTPVDRTRDVIDHIPSIRARTLSATESKAYQHQLLLWVHSITKYYSKEEQARLKDDEWSRKSQQASTWDRDYPIVNANIRVERTFTGDLDSPVPTPTNFISSYS